MVWSLLLKPSNRASAFTVELTFNILCLLLYKHYVMLFQGFFLWPVSTFIPPGTHYI